MSHRLLCCVRSVALVALLLVGVMGAGDPASARDHAAPSFDRDAGNGADFGLVHFSGPNDSGPLLWEWNTGIARYFSTFGNGTDVIVPGDYDGDRQTDSAVWRPGSPASTYFVELTSGGHRELAWGDAALGDLPVVGDFDGDGRTDFAVYRPGSPASTWFIRYSSGRPDRIAQWGDAAHFDEPVVADFDGDGRSNIAVRRPAPSGPSTFWWIEPTIFGPPRLADHVVHWGNFDDFAVPADYDGDGWADAAVTRVGADGNIDWYIYQTGARGALMFFKFGSATAGDLEVPADYDDDGIDDFAIWHRQPDNHATFADQRFEVRFSSTGQYRGFGISEEELAALPTVWLYYCLANQTFCGFQAAAGAASPLRTAFHSR